MLSKFRFNFFFICFSVTSIFLFLFSGSCFSQNTSFRFERYDTRYGLPNETIRSVYEDSRGFLWVATDNGMNRFDGLQFITVNLFDSLGKDLYTSSIAGVSEDIDHNLILAFLQGRVLVFNPVNNVCLEVKDDYIDSLGNGISSMIVDHKKNIWLMGSAAVIEFDPHFNFLRQWEHDLFVTSGAGSDINWIAGGFSFEDNEGNIWLSWNGHLNKIDSESGVVYNSLNNPARHKIFDVVKMAIHEDMTGNIWGANEGNTIIKYDPDSNKMKTFIAADSLHFSGGNFLLRNGTLWVSSYLSGYNLFDPVKEKFRFEKIEPSPDFPHGLETFTPVIEDRNGNLWCAVGSELIKTIPAKLPFHFYKMFGDDLSSFPKRTNLLTDIFLHDSMLLVSSTDGFLTFHTRTHILETYRHSPPGYSKKNHFWTSIPLDENHILLAGCEYYNEGSNGLFVVDLKSVSRIAKKFQLPHPSMLDSITVVAFFEDHLHQIWMGMKDGDGVFRWNRSSNKFTHYSMNDTGVHYFPFRHFSRAVEDGHGHLWMSYDKKGIACYDFRSERFIPLPVSYAADLKNDFINSMFADHDGNIWLCSSTGLIKCSLDSNKYRRYTLRDGMASIHILDGTCDKKGRIWIGTSSGISSFNPATSQFSNYTEKEGLPEESMSTVAFDPRHDKIYFLSDYSITWFDPDSIQKAITPLYPCITSFKVLGNRMSWKDNSTVNLSANQNSFSFDYAAPNMVNAQDNQYAYRLAGFDSGWVYAGARKFINYTSLPGGNYSFSIKASTDGLHWSEMKDSLNIHIATLFYKTLWFRLTVLLSIVLIVASIIYGFYHIRLQRILYSQRMRNKIASDLHDDIGSTLSSIAIYSELASTEVGDKSSKTSVLLADINENARATIDSMSDIVWAINPKNDRFENILIRMRTFASGVLEAKSIALSFTTEPSLTGLRLSMEQRKNLYLVFKEAINNAAKYSKAKNCSVQLFLQEKKMVMNITDDGIGFDIKALMEGNGLENMEKRAKEMKGKLIIQSDGNSGTSIQLMLQV